jgi:hypothetical protein
VVKIVKKISSLNLDNDVGCLSLVFLAIFDFLFTDDVCGPLGGGRFGLLGYNCSSDTAVTQLVIASAQAMLRNASPRLGLEQPLLGPKTEVDFGEVSFQHRL